MKHLKSFNEALGYPKSIDKYVDFLSDYILNEYDKWFFRKGLANQSFTTIINFTKEGLKIDKDFPLKKINLKLMFTIENWGSVATSGSVIYDFDKNYELEIRITTPKNIGSVDTEELKNEILEILSHEMTHFYQLYKSGKNICYTLGNLALYRTLTNYLYKIKENKIAYIFLSCIYLLSKGEIAAEMASLYKSGTTRMTPYMKWQPTFLKYISEENIDKILDELITKEYNQEYYHKFIDEFVDYYENYIEEQEGTQDEECPIMSILNLRGKELSDFVKFFVNKFKKTAKKTLYKIDKIKYGKSFS